MSSKFSSVSPLDGTVVWEGEVSDDAEIDTTMRRSAEASRSWRRQPLQSRIEIALAYRDYLQQHRSEIKELITREIGKLGWDADAEIAAAISKVPRSIEALNQRLSAGAETGNGELFDAAAAPRRRVRYQSLGVVVVLGPFNFPLHLPGGHIIPALLAGNAVVFKPSEQAVAVALWMIEAWRRSGLPENVLQAILGGADQAAHAIDSPLAAGVFLTGSRAAGLAIHRRLAGRPGVLLALELGGNNPILVTESASAEPAASIVSFSAFVTAGQRCTCARRAIFVDSSSSAAQLESLLMQTRRQRVGMPDEIPVPHVGPMISQQAADNLCNTYQRLLDLGCKPLIPVRRQHDSPLLVGPAIVDATEIGSECFRQIGAMEWFGPLLVVRRAANFDEAVRLAADTPYGLAAALLGGTVEMFETFVNEVRAGVVNFNTGTTGAAGLLPFGGLDDSGNHRPAGYFAIDCCQDPVASLERTEPPASDPWEIAK